MAICNNPKGGCTDPIGCSRTGFCDFPALPTEEIPPHVHTLAARMGGKFVPHVVEPVQLIGDTDFAAQLREIAGLVETGKVMNIVVAYDNLGERCLARTGRWTDRWHLLGVIEYLKGGLLAQGE